MRWVVVVVAVVMPDADIERLDEAGLRAMVAEVRRTQRMLDGVLFQVAARADQLAGEGRASAEELLLGSGQVPASTARRDTARAQTVAGVPGLGAAVGAGAVGGEHGSRHHHAVHEGKWSIRLRPDRALDIRRPDGTHHTSTDPPTRRPTPPAVPSRHSAA